MRLFIGLALPPEARAYAHRRALFAARFMSGAYALAENYHLTLAFLGDVPEPRLSEACEIMRTCAAAFPPPRVTLGALDHFGKPEKAILMLRASGEPPLEPLHDALVNALAAVGLPCQAEPFSPHVTLARRADARALPFLPTDAGEAETCAFRADCACLFLSARDEENVLRYTPLARAPFGGNG